MTSFICGIEKEIIQKNLQNRKRLIDLENELMVASGGKDKLGVWDQHIYTTIYKTDTQQGPAAWHRELYSMSWNSYNIRKRI